jgi:threonine/homoserine/homoserine lactone efflux protein
MPDPALFLSFLLTVAVLELTPGPNMTWLALLAASAGRDAGFAAVAGITLGLALQGLAAALGVAALLAAWPGLGTSFHLAGLAYLVWMAFESWRDAGRPEHHLPGGGENSATGFRHGLVTNLLNPKAAIFFVAVLPGFLPEGPRVAGLLVLSAVYLAVASAVHLVIVLAAGAARPWLADPAVSARLHRVQTLVLLAMVAWLFVRGYPAGIAPD